MLRSTSIYNNEDVSEMRHSPPTTSGEYSIRMCPISILRLLIIVLRGGFFQLLGVGMILTHLYIE